MTLHTGADVILGFVCLGSLLHWIYYARHRDTEPSPLIESEIRRSLDEKEVLLKEIHHRVKNNLQIISSLLLLQSEYVKDPRTLEMFKESQDRVKSMAMVHEYLYQSRDLATVNFPEYMKNLMASLVRSYATVSSPHVELDIENTPVSLYAVIPCGLMVTELVSNAFKYAFPNNRKGTILVRFKSRDDKHFELTVHDDGVGLPAGLVLAESKSLGLRLASMLTEQLEGKLDIKTSPGTTFTITFPGAKERRSYPNDKRTNSDRRG